MRSCLPLHQQMRGQLTLYYSTDDPMGVNGLSQHGSIQGTVVEEIERLHPDNPAQSAIVQELKQTIAAYFEAYSKRAKNVELCDLAALRDDIKEQLEREIEQKREAMTKRENARMVSRIFKELHKLEDELEYIDFYECNLLEDVRIYLERFCKRLFPDIAATSKESQQEALKPVSLSENQKRYLHEALLNKYLHSDTNYEQWCNVLDGKDSNPVLWVDFYQGQSVRVSTIGYLFYALQEKGYINEDQRNSFVKEAPKLFRKYDHKTIQSLERKSIINQMPPSKERPPKKYTEMLGIIDAMPKQKA